MTVLFRAKAPLRISFGGGGTDVPPFPQQEGGCVLSATINRYAWGTLRPRDDGAVEIHSLDLNQSLRYSSHEQMEIDGEIDLPKAAIRRLAGPDHAGVDLYLHSDAPPGSGLGSSSAMMVTLVGLLKEFHQLPLTDYEVADLAYVIEREDLGIQGGYQDQYAAAFGGLNFIEFLGDRVIVNGLNINSSILNELESNLLLCHTGTVRESAHIIEDQVERYRSSDSETTSALREIKHIAIEMKNALLRGMLDQFASLLDEEWQHKKRMSGRIATPTINGLYELARSEGAVGGKITGAGGGGYLLLYTPFDRKRAIATALRDAGCDVHDVAFARRGLQTWRVTR